MKEAFLLVVLLLPTSVLAATCNPTKGELDRWIKNAKTSVVFESEGSILNSNLDEAELARETQKKSPVAKCINEAISMMKQRPWKKDLALQVALKEFSCVGAYSISFVFNVHYQRGPTTFVRVRTSPEKGFKEVTVGGRYEGNNESCSETFKRQFRENVVTLLQKVNEKSQQGDNFPSASMEQIIQKGLEVPLPSFSKVPCVQ